MPPSDRRKSGWNSCTRSPISISKVSIAIRRASRIFSTRSWEGSSSYSRAISSGRFRPASRSWRTFPATSSEAGRATGISRSHGRCCAMRFSLTEDDLVRLAERGSQAHLAAIAGRSTVPEKVTDVLIDRGEREVVHTVTGNHGARFSNPAWTGWLEKAQEDVDLREMLVGAAGSVAAVGRAADSAAFPNRCDEARRARLRGEGCDPAGHGRLVAAAVHRRIAHPQGGYPSGLAP